MRYATSVGLLLSATLSCVIAFNDGAPSSKCSSMSPGHRVPAQESPSPYIIELSSQTFCPNKSVTVTLRGSQNFTGFLCQPRNVVDTYETSGQLESADKWSVKNNCDKAALTHGDNEEKDSFKMTWTPHANNTDQVYIVCTLVKDKVTFWEMQNSDAITYAGSDVCDDQGVTETCTSDLDCSGMSGTTCISGKCIVSGAKESAAFSMTLLLGVALFLWKLL